MAGALAGLVSLVLAGLLAGLGSIVARRLESSAFEPMFVVLFFARLVPVLVVVVGVLVALDLARIRLVREDGRGVARAFVSGLRLVLRHPLAAGGLWIGNALLLAAVAAAYLGLLQVLRADGWAGIALLALAQQVVMLTRAGLRVALFGSEIALVGRFWPAVAAPPLAEGTPLAEGPRPAEGPPPDTEPPSPS